MSLTITQGSQAGSNLPLQHSRKRTQIEPSNLVDLRRQRKSARRPRWLEFMGQSSREEGKSSSNLNEGSLENLAKQKPVHEKGKISWDQPTTSKERQLPGSYKTKDFQSWYGAKISTSSFQREWKNLIKYTRQSVVTPEGPHQRDRRKVALK